LLKLRASGHKTGLPESMAKVQELPASPESAQGAAETPKFPNET